MKKIAAISSTPVSAAKEFKPPMARHIYFSKVTEQDLNAIIGWLPTIPSIE